MPTKITLEEARKLVASNLDSWREFFLIQRAHRRTYTKPTPAGNLEFDYMGSAEFEFGALERTWNRFQELGDQSDLLCFDVEVQEGPTNPARTFWVIAPKARADERQLLAALIVGSGLEDCYSTKETTHMRYALGLAPTYRALEICAWHTIVREGRSTPKGPVFWTSDQALAFKVMDDLSNSILDGDKVVPLQEHTPVTADAISLFDVFDVMIDGMRRTGAEIRGIYEEKVKIKTSNGQILLAAYGDLRWPHERPGASASQMGQLT